LNIDFCCGGDTSLLTACEEEDLEPHWVYQRLVELQQRLRPEKKMFQV
jgi:iron-sulfur cluster repair protein YtfE (RIC family)